jgi:ATP-dependent helicase/nuclease subunit A
MRRNESGRQLVEVLRRECEGMAIAHEGSVAILDNPVVAALLALVKVAAHPGDTFAWRHVQMSPLLPALEAAGLTRESVARELLRRIFAEGMASFLREWGSALNRRKPLDEFGRRRWLDLVAAATAFDATGRREPDAFLSFMKAYTTPAAADKQAVRVMTIHQAKGLGFDMVVVPELMDRGLMSGDVPDVLIKRDPATEQPQWALKPPRRILAEADPVLAAELRRYDEDASFDALCVLYVALTRAKRGLYMVTSYPGASSKSFTAAALLKSRLCDNAQAREGRQTQLGKTDCTVLWETGDSAWFKTLARRRGTAATKPAAELPADFPAQPSRRVRLSRVEPSAEEQGGSQAAWLFNADSRDVLEFGTAIHELFREVGWIGETDADNVIRKWNARPAVTAEVRRDVLEQFRRSLAAEEVIRALTQPSGAAELWREKSFEVVLDGSQWVSGAFDRVTIMRDAKGVSTRAIILDYKSDRVAGESKLHKAVDVYRPQLELYRRALSALLRLDEERIGLQLLFTRAGRVLDL